MIAILHTRVELLAIELEEERENLIALIMLMLTALTLIGVGIVLSTILIIILYWDTYRLQVIAVLAGLFLLAGAVASRMAFKEMRALHRVSLLRFHPVSGLRLSAIALKGD